MKSYTLILLAFVLTVQSAFASYPGETPAFTSVQGGNIKASANLIESTNTNGDVVITPNGTGSVRVPTVAPGDNSTKAASTAFVLANGAGINAWVTGTAYSVGAVVIESNKIYRADTGHTASAAFITDIANWTQLANNVADASGVLPLGNGGTNKNLTANNGAVVYTDSDSAELLAPGTAGQILQTNGAGAPTFVNKSISGKSEIGSSVTVEEFQTQNNQLTQTASNKFLIESGNDNLLVNPSFEHSTVDTGWTIGTGGAASADTTNNIHGKKALDFSFSNLFNPVCIYQDTTAYQAQYAVSPEQGVASIKVLNTSANAVVCARNAGVDTTACLTVKKSSVWETYKIPFILGGTSNGISVCSVIAANSSFKIDKAFVGPSDVIQKEATVSKWQAYTPTFTGFGTVSGVQFEYRTVGENVEIRGKATAGTSTAVEARVSLPNSFVAAGTNLIPSLTVAGYSFMSISSGSAYLNNNKVLMEPNVSYVTFQAPATGSLSKGTGSATISSSGTISLFASIPVLGLGGTNDFYPSQSADYDWTACTGSGTWNNGNAIYFCSQKKKGSDMYVRYQVVTIGAPNSATLTIDIPNSKVIDVTKLAGGTAPSSSTSLDLSTSCIIEDSGSNSYPCMATYTSTTTLTLRAATASGTYAANTGVAQNIPFTFGLGDSVTFEFKIPVTGWSEASGGIVSLMETVNAPGILKPKVCYMQFSGATEASDCTGTCVERWDSCDAFSLATRSGSGAYATTVANGTYAPNSRIMCTCSAINGASTANRECYQVDYQSFLTNASGGLPLSISTYGNTGTPTDTKVSVKCEGLGN